MASDAVVTFVIRKLGDLLIQEAQLLHGVHDQFEWIQIELKRMQCFLKDADSKQKEDETVKNWVADIIRVSYDAEDVIDSFILSQNARRRHGFVERVKRYICVFTELITRHKVGMEIERIRMKINDISRSTETYRIREINEGRQEASSSSQRLQERRRLSALLEESEIVGLQEDISIVREQLINGNPRRCVISIVGMGGSGKTTLAKKVYNDVKNDFDCHAIISLSQKYEIKDILMRIIKFVMRSLQEGMERLNVDDLAMMLRDQLREKRYLVVIDDIWSTEAWDTLNLVLPDGRKKSRVMLTTRNKEVALYADSLSSPHEMRLLNDDESWKLFLKRIFLEGGTSTTCPSELEETGRKILAKCGGLPLAISVLGGLLSSKDKTLSAWSKVLDSVTWHLTESSDKCMEILALSYWDLPSYLKPCFLYLGLFPEDYEFKSGRLIKLWVAEGFIEQRENKIMEDVAEDCLEELVGRSMIQVASKKPNGSISGCHIHDLLRDLCISEARQNHFFTIYNENDTGSSSTSARRLAFHNDFDGYGKSIKSLAATLRSILCFSEEVDLSKLLNTSGRLLRVLDDDCAKKASPKEVSEFVHLRYLRLRGAPPNSFLSSIGNLSNLQTLKLTSSGTLPKTIWSLLQLRHLVAYHCEIDGQPLVNNLRSLQTLSLRAGSWIEGCLGKLNNLRKLGILGNLRPHQKTLSLVIEKLCSLRSLKLRSADSIPPFMPFTHHLRLYKMFLFGKIEKLTELPPNLVKLTLWKSELEQDAIYTLEKLQHLKILKLLPGSYVSKILICLSGGFPRLESLELIGLPIEEWIVEEGAMFSLKSVQLIEMGRLKTLPEQVRHISDRSTSSTRKGSGE